MRTRKSSILLKNIHGYRILFVPGTKNTLHIQSVIHSGFIDETKSTAGINHLLEHILVNAWKPCKEECITYWDNHGEYINANTNSTNMNYFIKGLATEPEKMVEYIATITTNPWITLRVTKREKNAVLEELNSSSGEPMFKLSDTFKKHFFKEEGLQYEDDWKQQVHNLKNLDLSDIKHYFDQQFNIDNILFIVYGDYSVSKISSVFLQHLRPRSRPLLNYANCFTNLNQFLFTPFDKESATILLGFPCITIVDQCDLMEDILHTLLFHDLRTIHHLIYDIGCNFVTNRCNTYLRIKYNIQSSHVKESLQLVFNCINKYSVSPPPKDVVYGCKKRVEYNILKNDLVDYYATFVYRKDQPLTQQQFIHKLRSFEPHHFTSLLSKNINFCTATCAYQNKHDLKLTWKSFTV